MHDTHLVRDVSALFSQVSLICRIDKRKLKTSCKFSNLFSYSCCESPSKPFGAPRGCAACSPSTRLGSAQSPGVGQRRTLKNHS